MFVGHFAVAFAGKKVAPRVSLGTWFLAAQFADLLWPICLLLGLEHVRIAPGATRLTPLDFTDYPITHSLVADIGWAVLVGALAFVLRRRAEPDRAARARAAGLLGLGVVSHWVLDLVVHQPDLPVWPGGARYGWGLWNHPAVEIPLELAMFVAGLVLYLRATAARDRIGRFGIWVLALFLVTVWLMSIFGAPPPNETALAWVSLSLWLLVLAAWWIDRHRMARGAEPIPLR